MYRTNCDANLAADETKQRFNLEEYFLACFSVAGLGFVLIQTLEMSLVPALLMFAPAILALALSAVVEGVWDFVTKRLGPDALPE